MIEVLHQCAQRVAVRGNKHILALLDFRHDGFPPIGQDALNRQLEGLGERQLFARDVGVLGLQLGVIGVVVRDRRRRDAERPTPLRDLCLAELGLGVGLVEALEVAIHTLVQLPALLDRDPLEVHLLEGELARLYGPLLTRRERDIECEIRLPHEDAGVLSLLCALLRHVDVCPPSKPVLKVPLRLAVPEQNEGVHALVVIPEEARRGLAAAEVKNGAANGHRRDEERGAASAAPACNGRRRHREVKRTAPHNARLCLGEREEGVPTLVENVLTRW
mmetsp:Transcript_42715/g.117926  ORF Transcript_42715/g.117926 Transcript_42715/m.117926 type:complete len:276 (-) Transcript_42715:13-840(-)